jgi:small-conductance mechanosensitive channel
VFVGQLEDRLVVTNDLNRVILARLIEEKILDPAPAAEFKLRDIDKLAEALSSADARSANQGTGHAAPPPR